MDLRNEENITVFEHPLIQHKISLLRDKKTGTNEFRKLVEEIAMLEGFEAMGDLELEDIEVETPIETCMTPMIAGRKLGADRDVDDGVVLLGKGLEEIDVLHRVCGSGFRGLAACIHMGKNVSRMNGDAVQISIVAHQDVHGHQGDVPLLQKCFGQVTGAVRSDLDLHVRYSSSVRRAGPQRVGFFKILNYHSTKA